MTKNNLNLPTEFYSWQQDILYLLHSKPNDRDIIWIVDTQGNTGKSVLCKYILHKFANTLFFTSCEKTNDITYQILKFKKDPEIFIFDIPRSSREIPYEAMEQIKNGNVSSSKYSGGTKSFNSPHLIVFANRMPDISSMTLDRWKIKIIDRNFCLKDYHINQNLLED